MIERAPTGCLKRPCAHAPAPTMLGQELTVRRRITCSLWGLLILLVASQLVLLPTGMAAEAPEADSSTIDKPEAVASEAQATFPSVVQLVVGELRPMSMDTPSRIAIGDPKICDVTIVSKSELMLQAKALGTTNLVVWDRNGQHATRVNVIKEAATKTVEELTRILDQLNLTDVQVREENANVFLTGTVATPEDLANIEQIISPYPDVKNLVSTLPTLPPPVAPPLPMIRLAVQMIELNRDSKEQLGVKWNEKLLFTEAAPHVEATFLDPLLKRVGDPFRVGTLTRTGFSQVINFMVQNNKARILAEPTLVTTSGKEATSFMGSSIPFIVGAGIDITVEFKDVGVTLTMTPTILESDEKISTVVKALVSDVSDVNGITVGGIFVPSITKRNAETEVTTSSGETIVIAGLMKQKNEVAVGQVPGLGSMPVVGRLFRSPETKSDQTELVIAITPQLKVDEGQAMERTFALDQALSTAEVTSAVNDPRLRYSLQIQDRIAKALRYPQRERELSIDGRVKLRLHLFADGTLGRVVVAESSGSESLDAAALKAAESQAPYPAFPSQIAERDLWLELPVLFRSS